MLRKFLRSRSRSRSRFWQGRVAEVQTCEPRLLPAGTVLVTFVSNTLTITGDNKANDIAVTVGATGAITITGSAADPEEFGSKDTKIRFGGTVRDGGETVTLPTPTAAVGIIVNLKAGRDHLSLSVADDLGTLPFKNLAVDLGDEDDFAGIAVGFGTTLNFSDIVSISTGEGEDVLYFDINGTVNITKALTINGGADSDGIFLSVNGALTAKAATSFLTGDGDDRFVINGEGHATFENTLNVNTGEDSDSVDFNLEQGLIAKAAVTITTADGDDRVQFLNERATLDFQKGLTADLGTGDDHFALSDNGFQGTLVSGLELKVLAGSGDDEVRITQKLTLNAGLTITTGDGRDNIEIVTGRGSSEDDVVANVIKGKLTIDTGDDSDVVELTVNGGTALAVNGAAAITTGRGNDDVELFHEASAVSFTAGLTIDTGATAAASSGEDEVHLLGDILQVIGALKIETGARFDLVSIATTLVAGDVIIGTGTGIDTVYLDLFRQDGFGVDGPAANTLKSLTINSGSGSDYVELSNFSDEESAPATLAISGNVSIITGTGEDEIEIVAGSDLTIGGNLNFDTGAGDDRLLVTADKGSLLVKGSESVILGDDDDTFIQGVSYQLNPFREEAAQFFGEKPDVTLQIDVNLTVTGGTGNDFLGFAGVQVGKDRPTLTAPFPASLTTLDLGAGNDVVSLTHLSELNEEGDEDFVIGDQIFRDLKILTGDGDDIVRAEHFQIRGTTNIDLGTGHDQLFADDFRYDPTLRDNVTLNGGTGDDQFALGIDINLAEGKKVALNGGAGTDSALNLSDYIPESAFNPAPIGIENLDAEIDIDAINEAVNSLFRDFLGGFEYEDIRLFGN